MHTHTQKQRALAKATLAKCVIVTWSLWKRNFSQIWLDVTGASHREKCRGNTTEHLGCGMGRDGACQFSFGWWMLYSQTAVCRVSSHKRL